MSLDVYLLSDTEKEICHCCGNETADRRELFNANITHNLYTMAEEAGIHQHLWRPEELGITTAGELIEPIKKGLEDMKNRPNHYKKFNSENGWGTYVDFIPWIERYLEACIEYPEAIIGISR